VVIERIDFVGNVACATTLCEPASSAETAMSTTKKLSAAIFRPSGILSFLKTSSSVSKTPQSVLTPRSSSLNQRAPQIRRIRYDGMHSISESDILDRFKERKVGLSVESQFDPTKIKKPKSF